MSPPAILRPTERLGTAQFQEGSVVARDFPYAPGSFWLGRAEDGSPLGFDDDRHVCLVCGTRGGKGTSSIINNLALWPGSAVVIDPKGENATITAARRGQGDKYCTGLLQDVHVLDPDNVARVDDCYRSSFNPLAGLDINDEKTLNEASRIANALVIVHEGGKDSVWEELARTLVRGLILHVLSADRFDDRERNLPTVAELVQCGDELLAATMRKALPDKQIDQPHLLLFKAMQENPAFGGRVARIGSQFRTMLENSAKQFQSVLLSANQNTEFLDSPGMIRVLSGEGRTFKLSDLKTNSRGLTVYLSLPLYLMRDTHFRWLRMMVDLITTQMEITRVAPPRDKAAPTATGYPLLMALDEFRALQRMDTIKAAAPFMAGYGVKLFYVVQNLAQLHELYQDGWEDFFGNAGLKIFFSIDDNFTRDYVSKHVGETEIMRDLHTVNESESESDSNAFGTTKSDTRSKSSTQGTSRSSSESYTEGESQSENQGTSSSTSFSETDGTNQSTSTTHGTSSGSSTNFNFGKGGGTSISNSAGASDSSTFSHGSNHSTTKGTTQGVSHGTTKGTSSSFTQGLTFGTSESETLGTSETDGTSQTHTTGTSRSAGRGRNQSIHRRPLLQPDEVGRHFARIVDKANPLYPGLALVIASGDAGPMMVRRVNYFDDPFFIDCFTPNPEHPFSPALAHGVNGVKQIIDSIGLLWAASKMGGKRNLYISKWLIKPGQMVRSGQVAAKIEGVPPDNRTVRIIVPWAGKVSKTSQARPSDDAIPDGHLFIAKSYAVQKASLDPLRELRKAYEDALAFAKEQKPEASIFDHPDFAGMFSNPDPKPKPKPKMFAWERAGLALQLLVVAFSLGVIIWLGVALYHVIARHF